MIITKTVDVDINIEDVLTDIPNDMLIAEMEERELYPEPLDQNKLELIYEEFRRRGDAPQVLRDFLYEQIGRTL